MKKILVVLIVVIMVFSLSACGNPNQKALVVGALFEHPQQ